MDWRAISRSRSRISTMDWRPSSRSRSRPPPGQPFDQGNFSNSWTEGKFATFPLFGDPTALPGPAFAMSKSFDTSYMVPPSLNEHATSSSIPIPGIATQLRYGTPPISSSLQSHAAHLAAIFQETGDYTSHSGLQFTNSSGAHSGPANRVTHPEPFLQRHLSASLQPSPLHMSMLSNPLRQRPNSSTPELHQGGPLAHFRKTSLDHMGHRSNAFSFLGGHAQGGSDEILAPLDPILVCNY